MQVIAVANHKGGVGKTTTTGYLGVGLAAAGRRTLVVDLDHQAHATRWLLTPTDFDELDADSVDAFLHARPLTDSIVHTQWPGLDLAPSSANMAAVEAGLVLLPRREERLRRALMRVASVYDYAVLDCPPSAGLIAQNALAAAGWILAPIEAANFAIAGLSDFYLWVEAMRDEGVHHARWLGLLPTKFDARTRISREMWRALTQVGITVLIPIPERVGIEDLIAARTVASERRLPEIGRAYGLAVQHVIETVESGTESTDIEGRDAASA